MIQKILRELYDVPGWVIGHVEGPLSGKQIRVNYGIKRRNAVCQEQCAGGRGL